MKKIVCIFLSIAMLVSAATAVLADGSNGPIQKAKLTVGINAQFPPFEYYNENKELYGFDIDLMHYIGERIGFEIEYVNMPFDQLIPAVMSGEVACSISAISITGERNKVIDYTIPYLSAKVTHFDGETSNTSIEQYAIVFPNNSAEKGKLTEAAGEPEKSVYNLVNNAISNLIEDKTIEKLGEKYELNKAADTDDFDYEYTVMPVPDDFWKTNTDKSEPTSDGTLLAPPSDWALSDVQKAEALNITEQGKVYRYRMSITREEFCELIYNFYWNLAKNRMVACDTNPFTDTKNEHIALLNAMGIIYGKSETEFAPNDLLTREEAATILFRIYYDFKPETKLNKRPAVGVFLDDENISAWAYTGVYIMASKGIEVMVGDGNNLNYYPKRNLTLQEAIVALVRLYASSGVSKSDDMTFADKLNANMPPDKNYLFSPLSIKMALMMAANGATGETLEEILKVTEVTDLKSYNESVKLMLDKYSESDILTLNVSNSIWINADKTHQRFGEAYQDNLSKIFDATSDIVTDKNAVSEINGWVNDKTEGKIPTIITESNKDFWAMLVNAVYFKGRWLNEFDKGATNKDVFASRDGSQTEIDFMNRRAWMSYGVTDGVSIVALPYLTRQDVFNENGEYIETKKLDDVNISMYLMMSDGSFSPEEILNKTEMNSTYITLSVPKFNIEYSTGLDDILKTIGINKAFREGAEFEKMFDKGNMWIDSSIHKTYIKVDEEGTEAAAVTALGMAGSAMPPEPIEVKFNKPFTFVIKDNANGEILFMGEYAFA